MLRGRPYEPAVEQQREVLEHLVGIRPATCPWRSLEDPLVRDVLTLYGPREMSDPVHLAGGDEAPCRVIEGLIAFDAAMRAFRSDERKRAEEQREQERRRIEASRRR